MTQPRIRPADPADDAQIAAVVAAAFGRADEARLVQRLGRDGDAVISLVASQGEAIIGHVLLSRMRGPFPALGLAPVSVLPARQGQGVGAALIREAITQAQATDAAAIFVLGDQSYYGRYGFDVAAAAGFACRFGGPHFAVRPLKGPLPQRNGAIAYAEAFDEAPSD